MKTLIAILVCVSVGMGQNQPAGFLWRDIDTTVVVTQFGELQWRRGISPPPTLITLENWQEYVASCEPTPQDIEDSLRTLVGRIRNLQSKLKGRPKWDEGYYLRGKDIDHLLAPMGYRRTPSWEGFAEWLIKRREKR